MLALFMALICAMQARAGEEEKTLQKWASFTEPAGWAKAEHRYFGGPSLRYSRGHRTISVHLLGDKESKFPSVEAYLQSLQARGLLHPDAPPQAIGKLNVGGNEVAAYRVKSFVPIGDPNFRTPTPLHDPVEETFVVVPVGGRFFVLKFAIQGFQPTRQEDRDNQAVEWLAFLRSFRLKNQPEKK
jgi:hypothetical protein